MAHQIYVCAPTIIEVPIEHHIDFGKNIGEISITQSKPIRDLITSERAYLGRVGEKKALSMEIQRFFGRFIWLGITFEHIIRWGALHGPALYQDTSGSYGLYCSSDFPIPRHE